MTFNEYKLVIVLLVAAVVVIYLLVKFIKWIK